MVADSRSIEKFDRPWLPKVAEVQILEFLEYFAPSPSTVSINTMSLQNTHFEDSEDEDDFNPQQADISDNEDAGGSDHDDDAGAQIRNEVSRRSANVDDGSDDEQPAPSRRRSSADQNDGEEDEDDEDAEGPGEDLNAGADDDDEEDEDDEEEEITVGYLSCSLKECTDKNFRATAENAVANAVISSSMSKPRLTKMRTRTTMMRTSSTKSRTILLPIPILMISQTSQLGESLTTRDIANSTVGVRWRQVLMPRNKPKSCDKDMPTRIGLVEGLEILRLCPDVCYSPVLTTRVSTLCAVRRERNGRLFSL